MMRRTIYFVLPFLMAVLFVSCSSNSPRGVAEKALDCAIKEDYRCRQGEEGKLYPDDRREG